ncbi:hypothetical protein ACFX13_000030 [Malus domestica]
MVKGLPHSKMTTFHMAGSCCHHFQPKVDSRYLGNAIQNISIVATIDELLFVEDWESEPRLRRRDDHYGQLAMIPNVQQRFWVGQPPRRAEWHIQQI